MKNPLLIAISALWITFIGYQWIYHHSIMNISGQEVPIQLLRAWQEGTIWRALLPLITVIIAYGIYALWCWMWHGRSRIQIQKMTAAKITGVAVLIGIISWNIAAFFRPMAIGGDPSIPGSEFFSANIGLLGHLAIIFLWGSIVLLAFQAAGQFALRLFRIDPQSFLEKTLFQIGIGVSIWSIIILILAWAGIYSWLSVVIVAAIIFALSWETAWGTIRGFFTKSWLFEASFFDLRIWSLIFISFLLAANITDIIRPIPIGWDDLGQYLNTARIIATRGSLGNSGGMIPVELLMSSGYLFASNAQLAMVVSWLGGLLGALTIYAIGRRFWSASVGILAATIWYTMPMIAHISYADMKVDPMLFFVSALSIWALLEWTHSLKKTHWLYLMALTAGIAWSIKITTAFLLVGLTVAFLFQLGKWTDSWKKKLISALIAVGIFLIPFAPWVAYTSSTRGWQIPTSLGMMIGAEGGDRIIITDEDWEAIGVDRSECVDTTGVEELDRYSGHLKGLRKYIRYPWDLTMNSHINDLYLIIGFLYLALIPIWLLRPKALSEMGWPTKSFIIFSIAYWVSWAWKGLGIPWYGIAGFLPLTLGAATLVFSLRKPKWLHWLIVAVAIISIFANLTLRLNRYANREIARYAGGQITDAEFIANILPSYNEIAAIIESDDERVYRVGTFIPYFIEDNDRRLYNDNQFGSFSCIDSGQNDAQTVERLRQLGFKHFILDLNAATIEKDPNGTLHQKGNRFVNFANKNLRLVINNPSRGIAFMQLPE